MAVASTEVSTLDSSFVAASVRRPGRREGPDTNGVGTSSITS
jgi:hypothetical protein